MKFCLKNKVHKLIGECLSFEDGSASTDGRKSTLFKRWNLRTENPVVCIWSYHSFFEKYFSIPWTQCPLPDEASSSRQSKIKGYGSGCEEHSASGGNSSVFCAHVLHSYPAAHVIPPCFPSCFQQLIFKNLVFKWLNFFKFFHGNFRSLKSFLINLLSNFLSARAPFFFIFLIFLIFNKHEQISWF